MPYCLIALKSLPKRRYFLRESIKYTSNILSRQFLQDFFIGLREDNGWRFGNLILFEGLG
jgi:hypothetical protein